jgi:hypothetical protein
MNSLTPGAWSDGFAPRMSIFALHRWMWSVLSDAKQPQPQTSHRSHQEQRAAMLVQQLLLPCAHPSQSVALFHAHWEALTRLLRYHSVPLTTHYRIDPTHVLDVEALSKEAVKQDCLLKAIALNVHPNAGLMVHSDLSVTLQNLHSAHTRPKDVLKQKKPETSTIWFGRCNQTAVDVTCFQPNSVAFHAPLSSTAGTNGPDLICVQLNFNEAEAAALAHADSTESRAQSKRPAQAQAQAKAKAEVDAELMASFKGWQSLYPQLSKHFGTFGVCEAQRCSHRHSHRIGWSLLMRCVWRRSGAVATRLRLFGASRYRRHTRTAGAAQHH